VGGGGSGILSAAVALWVAWRAARPADRPLVRLDVDLGADVSLPDPTYWSTVVISHDGTRLVYASGNPVKLFTRRLDQPRGTELPGTQGAEQPFFSPDGQWVGFHSNGKLKEVSVEGGAVVPLGEVPDGVVNWGEDGSIIVSELYKGLFQIPAGGGTPETLAEVANGEIVFSGARILPGGKAVLFVAVAIPMGFDVDKFTIEAITLSGRRRKILARGGASPRYLATANGESGRAGYLVYVNGSTLFAMPFDPDKLETHGTAVPVLDDVAYSSTFGSGQFDVSSAPSGHGTLVYRRASGGAPAMTTLQSVDPTGKREPLRAKPGIYNSLSLSPDGSRVALEVNEGVKRDIWVYDLRRDAMTRLTFGGARYHLPIWSPDGQYVVFLSVGNGIFQARADGAGQLEALTQSKARQIPEAFTPDGSVPPSVETCHFPPGPGYGCTYTSHRPDSSDAAFSQVPARTHAAGTGRGIESNRAGRKQTGGALLAGSRDRSVRLRLDGGPAEIPSGRRLWRDGNGGRTSHLRAHSVHTPEAVAGSHSRSRGCRCRGSTGRGA
jgi:hypothetical protein